jgi:hypothetical protein
MAVTANSIITPQAPKSNGGTCTTANASYTAPTNTVVVYTAGANGARLTRVSALTVATLGAALECQLFRDTDGTGTTKRFLRSRLMAAYTVAVTTAQTEVDFGFSESNALILAAGEKLYAAISTTVTGVTFSVEGADY